MRSDAIVQHDDGTPTGSRSTSFFIRGILGPDAWSIFMRWLRRLAERFSVAASLVGHPGDGWRFRAGCSIGRLTRLGVLAPLPMVDIAVLTALATLLQDVTSVSGAPSQLRDSGAALGSHDANRGDVHAPAYRSPPSSQQCTSVRSVLRPAHRRGADAAMAGVARGDAPYADEADGPPDLRSRRRRPRSETGGDAS